MQVTPTALDGVVELVPVRHGDARGWFSEVWNKATLDKAGVGTGIEWVQDNESLSAAKGTIRGIHFQTAPHAQDKLIRVIHGRILDVAVDLRRSSPTFGHHVGVELSAETGNQLLVPRGFGHGFCTLKPNCVISYKVSDYYSPECDSAIAWNDPDLAIDWPVTDADAIISAKDQAAPTLASAGDRLFA
jgi:dTDP-4-dehydrorhamnose 3,5-epimerase